LGILWPKGVIKMNVKGWALTLGVGAAAGAVAIMMLPKQNPVRKLAVQTAQKAEDAALMAVDKLTQ
jgi:hypothetical protein